MRKMEKLVLITGGAGGFGSALARALNDKGYRLALADIDYERVKKTAESIDKDVSYHELDASDETSVRNPSGQRISEKLLGMKRSRW